MTGLLTGRPDLLRRLAELEARERTPAVRLALAEAEFRLAVLPGAEPAEAVDRLRRAVRHDPYAAKAHLTLGRLLHEGGRRWSALAAYREAHRQAPGSRRPLLLMATALIDLDRPARAVAAELLAALADGDRERIEAAVGAFDELVQPSGPAPARRSKRPPGRAAMAAAEPAAWHAMLLEQMARKPPTGAWIRDYLHDGLDRPAAAAAGAVLVACGAPADAVREAPGVADPPDHAANRLLAATLMLAEAPAAGDFVRLATGLLSARMVPAELVCVLHYSRWAEPEDDVAAALRALDAYPPGLRAQECFRQLRLAVLGGHAERAWAGERFAEAGVLWQEMARLAPEQSEVAVNLAMLATRTRSSAYRVAWDGAAELCYAAAARAGDLRYRAGDRIALHRAHSMQSLRVAGSDQPDAADLRRWLADGDAVEVWLREWDLYYLNARLGFRSPAHLLAVASGAAGDERATARDGLVRQLDRAVGGRGWRGADEFRRLAAARIEEAYAAAPPDVHREIEQPAAEQLMDEAFRRALLLRRLADELSAGTAARPRELSCAVLRHLFLLPLAAIDRYCAEQGLTTPDERLVDLLDRTAAGVAWNWTGSSPAGKGNLGRMLADVTAAAAAAPASTGLAVPHSRLLLWSGRGSDAYAEAVSALPGAPDLIRDWLTGVIDDVAEAELASRTAKLDNTATLAEARRMMTEFPLSIEPRVSAARCLLGLGGDAHRAEAVRLFADGARTALTERRRDLLYRSVRGLASWADPHVRRLIEEHWRRFQRDHDASELEHAARLAEARRFGPQAERLRDVLTRLRAGGESADVHG